MAISIDRPTTAAIASNVNSKAQDAQAGAAGAGASKLSAAAEQVQKNVPQGGEVQLSGDAQTLKKAFEKLRDQPAPEDRPRIESLKKAVVEGSYQVDNQRLASKIIAFESSY